MAADTFETCWREARLLFGSVPAFLVRSWVQDAYTRLCDYRGGGWSFLRKEARISILASRTLSVTFLQGSTTITSVGGFVASDAGRAIKVSSVPVYTIVSVTNANTAIIDPAYAAVNSTSTATIFDAYFTAPTDFKRFLIIVDPYYQRVLPFDGNQDQIGWADPARLISDTGPRFLIAATPSPATATLAQFRYEYRPYPTSARQYPYLYYQKAARLADTDNLPGVFSNRSDLLKLGAQVMAAEWPGTADQRNPYYNLRLAERLTATWELLKQQASLDDDNQAPEDLMTIHWVRRYYPLAAPTSYLRQTDATLADYM